MHQMTVAFWVKIKIKEYIHIMKKSILAEIMRFNTSPQICRMRRGLCECKCSRIYSPQNITQVKYSSSPVSHVIGTFRRGLVFETYLFYHHNAKRLPIPPFRISQAKTLTFNMILWASK